MVVGLWIHRALNVLAFYFVLQACQFCCFFLSVRCIKYAMEIVMYEISSIIRRFGFKNWDTRTLSDKETSI